jgi:phytanoyl-CoA hydroxylase
MNKSLPTYTSPADGVLSAEMCAEFEESGVIVLRDFVSTDACAALRQRALELIDEFDPSTVRSVFSSKSDEHQADDYFIESGDKIRFFLENGAFDENGQLRQAKEDCLNKMGHAMHDLDGGEVVCHQDSTYIYTEPKSCVGFWFALEDATIENGCMHFIPGAHKQPLRKRNYRKPDGSVVNEILDDTPFDAGSALPAEAAAGTLVIFDGAAPHLSAPNTSDKSRHAYTLHTIDRQCHYPASNWLQRSEDLPLRGFGN